MKNRIKELRQSAGPSQLRLAEIIGVTRQTINAIENNKYDPTLALAFALGEALGVSVDSLFDPDNTRL